MPPARRRSARRGQRVVEQGGIFAKRSGEVLDRGLAPFAHELGQLLESCYVFRCAARAGKRGEERDPMLGEAVAQGSAGARGARGGERPKAVARECFRRPPISLANAADGGMRMQLLS